MRTLDIQNLDIHDYLINSNFEKVAEIARPLSSRAQNAQIEEIDLDNIDENKFAVVINFPDGSCAYKYACYTPELVELNMACLVDKMHELPAPLLKTAAANLTYAAKNFKIPIPQELHKYASNKYISRHIDSDSIKYVSETANLKKTAEAKKHVFALGNNYPIDTPQDMIKAAHWFDRNHNKLSIDEILEFTENMIKQAGHLGIDLKKDPEYKNIYKYASLDLNSFNPDLYNHISIRKSYISDDPANDEIRELYDDILRKADQLGVEKTAYLIEYADKEVGLDSLYGKIFDPLQTVCQNTLVKTAGMLIDDREVSIEEIKKIPNEELTAIVGNDGIKELKGKDGLDILASLPKPLREEVFQLIDKYA